MDTSRHALETDYERYAKSNRDHLAAVLRSKVQQDQDKASMQALADSTPILMYRPMVAAAILLAVAAGKLSVDDTLKSRLEATGQLALFKALGSNSRCEGGVLLAGWCRGLSCALTTDKNAHAALFSCITQLQLHGMNSRANNRKLADLQ